MRADPYDYQLAAPPSLGDVLALMANAPGEWLPIAGGTDLMVLYAAGKLAARKLIDIWNLPELRRVDVAPDEVCIGAGCTYTDIREHPVIAREFPLLPRSAAWTGGIAIQNRGTLGGNIANASPAADSLPALLVYDAELILISARGERCVPYRDFHTGYKTTVLKPDELIRAICIKRAFSGYCSFSRKVGTRNAQAISKLFLAGVGRMSDSKIQDVRLATGSVAPVPLRLTATERVLLGQSVDSHVIETARAAMAAEIQPIDDIRSTARYRTVVLGNLLEEFLKALARSGTPA